ncbi:MAG: hypothetical protein A2857_01500 [Candidatus Levybacteria bacterium RIFCSPHIGHO2_01_FULL_36_15]|nr:MAG: hypothetical protein A2857_01500 [Candidatus Levybacteria bacterium RIFCSPHIGHO2_01_FULL_36_15]OGH39276.1 MAG: hypothetical protein A2905_00230 [Candidatus Levybacteria bacterium RIFCSPLOWO2_01_FULL_36_10]
MPSNNSSGTTNQDLTSKSDKSGGLFIDPKAARQEWEKFAQALGRPLSMDEKAAADMGIPPVKTETPVVNTAVLNKPQDVPVSQKEKTVLPPRGMDEDPKYKDIREQLKAQWLKEKDEKDFESEEGKNFLAGVLENKAISVFRASFPELSKKYDEMEKTRIYDNPESDPAIKNLDARGKELVRQEIEARMAKGNNPSLAELTEIEAKDAELALDDFIINYAVKASEYAKVKPEIKDAIAAKAQKEKEQKKLVVGTGEEIGKSQNQNGAGQGKQEGYTGPPRGIDEDPKYKAIVEQLTKTNTPANQIKKIAVDNFRQANPQLAEKYDEMEKTRVYADPQQDPVIQELEQRISDKIHVKNELRKGDMLRLGEDKEIRDEVHNEEYARFIRIYPQKAIGYADSQNPNRSTAIAEALKKVREDDKANIEFQEKTIQTPKTPEVLQSPKEPSTSNSSAPQEKAMELLKIHPGALEMIEKFTQEDFEELIEMISNLPADDEKQKKLKTGLVSLLLKFLLSSVSNSQNEKKDNA